MREKTKVLMVCAHEPSLDPRIRWEAESAAGRFDVTVLGFNRADGSLPRVEMRDGYRIVRLPHIEASALHYFWRLKDIAPRWLLLLVSIAAVPLLPVLIAAEIVFRLMRAGWRFLTRDVVTLSLLWWVARRGRDAPRRGLLSRARFIFAVLRVQFAPAAMVFWAELNEMPKKPDVIHCNDLDTLLVGVLGKRRFGCRVVYDAHEFWPVADSLCSWLDTTFFSLIERMLIGKADAVVTVNPLLGEEIRRTYGLKRVYSVPNVEPWVDDRSVPTAKSAMSELAAGRTKFLFQGRFTVARGIDELILAWAEVDHSKAALFLRGPDNAWRRTMMADADRLGLLDESIYFLDAVSEDELVAAAAEADVGIIPYLPLAVNERLSCPNKLSQYLHAGLMVLTNDLPYVRSVVEEAGAGTFYDSRWLSSLVHAVDRIAADSEMLRRCKGNARRFARDSFNWQAYQDILLDLYDAARGDVLPRVATPANESLRVASS